MNFKAVFREHARSLSWVIVVMIFALSNWVADGVLPGPTVMWDSNPEPDIAGYKVYLGTNSHGYTTVFDTGNQTSQIISNLAEGATYYVAVTAYDLGGLESDFSEEASYTVPVPAPTLTFTMAGNNSLRIYFEGIPGATYWIEYTPGLDPPVWKRLGSRTANYLGQVEYIDVPDGSLPTRFYRAMFPSSPTNNFSFPPLPRVSPP